MTAAEGSRASIKQQLAQTQKNEAMTKWVDELKKDYKDKVSYATGFTPPPDAKSTTSREQVAACLSARRSKSCRS